MMKMKYTVYDTETRKYLAVATLPDGDPDHMATEWTRNIEKAWRFPGLKSAAAMVVKLGSYSQFVVKNGRGVIVG